MGTKVKSTSLDTQTYITAVSGGATLRGNWYIGTSGLGSGGTNPGTLNGPLNGNATSADKWSSKVVVNGTDLDGATTPVTIKVNTTSNPAAGTYYPVFVPSSSAGNQQASTSSSTGFTFNPNTNALTVTGNIGAANFSGSSSGTNTGDQTLPTLSSLGGAALSGATFTGTISATNFSGSSSGTNTGDQDLSSYAPKANPVFTGTTTTQNINMENWAVPGSTSSYKISMQAYDYFVNGSNLIRWDYHQVQLIGSTPITRQFVRTNMALGPAGDLTIAGSYYGDGSHLTGIAQPTVPTVVSAFTNDAGYANTFYGGLNGISAGMGAVPGYTYTVASGGVDDTSVTWNVPSTGFWSFVTLNLYFMSSRISTVPWLNTTCYVVVALEVYDTSSGSWFPVSAKTWDSTQANSVTGDGNTKYVGAGGVSFQTANGIGAFALTDLAFNKPYYLTAGAHIRLHVIWSPGTSPSVNDTIGINAQSGQTYGEVTGAKTNQFIALPSTYNFQWRAYPNPISASAYWYMGGAAHFSMVKMA
jgi:hypothetical protein